MSSSATIKRHFLSPLSTTPDIPYMHAISKAPTPTKEERQLVAYIFAENMERLLSPQTPLPSLSSDEESDYSEEFVEKLKLTSAAEPRRIQVKPKECDLQKLNAEIAVVITLLQSISFADKLPIDIETCENLSCTVAMAHHHILNHPKSDAVRAKSELPSKTNDPDLHSLKVCQNLADTLEANLRIIKENLTRSDKKTTIMHLRPGFGRLSYAIASESVETTTKLPEGAYGVTSLITLSNGTRYVIKRPLTEAEIASKCPPTTPFYARDGFIKDYKAKSILSLAREASINYFLPASYEGFADFLGVDEHKFPLFQYISGGELLNAIIEKKLSIEQISALAKSLANTMAYLHQQNVIHADFKPENVMLTDDLKSKIIDFGAARTGFTTAELQEKIGTLKYLAPEALTLGQPRDNKIDVWSYGCTLYLLLTERFFFDDLFKAYHQSNPSEKTLEGFFKKNQKTVDRTITELLSNLDLRKKSPSLTRLYLALSYSLKVDPKERSTMKEISELF